MQAFLLEEEDKEEDGSLGGSEKSKKQIDSLKSPIFSRFFFILSFSRWREEEERKEKKEGRQEKHC